MTADMPDPVKVAREACAREEERIGMPGDRFREGKRDGAAAMSWAVLGARAMQDAMAGREVRVPDGWVAVPLVGAEVKASHPITVLNPDPTFEVIAVEVDSQGARVRGDKTCWFGMRGVKPALEPAGAQEGADQKPAEKPCVIPFGYSCEVCGGDELNCRMDANPTNAPIISDETIKMVRAHAIHNAVQGGMTQAEAEDHFGKPTPAPDVPWLVRRAHRIADDLKMLGLSTAEAEIRQAADALEALQAEVEDTHAQIAELEHRRRADTAVIAGYTIVEARATAAEAERDALRVAGERYLNAVAALGEQSGYNHLTYFETPILKAPTDEIGDECCRRWAELNDAGKALRTALLPAKAGG